MFTHAVPRIPPKNTATVTTTSKTFTGLTNGTAYTTSVAATNAVGTGPATTSNAVTPAGVPGVPGSVNATAGDQALTVTWTAAGANGSAVTGYTAVVVGVHLTGLMDTAMRDVGRLLDALDLAVGQALLAELGVEAVDLPAVQE